MRLIAASSFFASFPAFAAAVGSLRGTKKHNNNNLKTQQHQSGKYSEHRFVMVGVNLLLDPATLDRRTLKVSALHKETTGGKDTYEVQRNPKIHRGTREIFDKLHTELKWSEPKDLWITGLGLLEASSGYLQCKTENHKIVNMWDITEKGAQPIVQQEEARRFYDDTPGYNIRDGKQYHVKTEGLIFVIDAYNRAVLDIAKEQLKLFLSEGGLKSEESAALLVYVNTQMSDGKKGEKALEKKITAAEIKKTIHDIAGKQRRVKVLDSSTASDKKKDSRVIVEGWKWLNCKSGDKKDCKTESSRKSNPAEKVKSFVKGAGNMIVKLTGK